MNGGSGMRGLRALETTLLAGLMALLLAGGVLMSRAVANAPIPAGEPPVPGASAMEVSAPASVKQGEVLQVRISATRPGFAATALLAGRKAWFFKQEDGSYLALVPVSVFQAPGAYKLRIEEAGGEAVDKPVQVANAYYRTQNISVSSATKGLQPLPGELEAIQALKDKVSPVRYWQGGFITPTPDCQNSPFGVKRYHNGKATGDYHKGVDLRSPAGRPIKAINDGRVEIARMFRLHGGTVGLDHGQGVGSIYIHMSKLAVKEGQLVHKGDVIGYVGATGFATGPHLHWGMYMSGLPVNPNQWIKGVPTCG